MAAAQIVPVVDCARGGRISALLSLVLTMFALAAGWISWRSVGTTIVGFGAPRTLRFDATISALSALLFAFALGLQTVASLVLTGCEH
jgi:hypothetical protein